MTNELLITDEYDELNRALKLLSDVNDDHDFMFLYQLTLSKQGLPAYLYGVRGGMRRYKPRSEGARQFEAALDNLSNDHLRLLQLVTLMAYERTRPITSHARGCITVKVVKRSFPHINYNATDPKGVATFEYDENEQIIMDDVFYRYAYVEFYGARANRNKRGSRYLSFYADEGMGKRGTGGYVAAALDNKLIERNHALDAYHLGPIHYTSFIEHCKLLVHTI